MQLELKKTVRRHCSLKNWRVRTYVESRPSIEGVYSKDRFAWTLCTRVQPDTIALCSRSPGGLYCACNNVHRIVLHRGHYSCNTGTWHRFKNHAEVICGAPILPSMNKTARGLPATSGSLCFQFSYLSQLLGPFAHLNNIFMSLGHT